MIYESHERTVAIKLIKIAESMKNLFDEKM